MTGRREAEWKEQRVKDYCPQHTDASRRLFSHKPWDSRGYNWETLALLRRRKSTILRVLKVMTDCSHSSPTQRLPVMHAHTSSKEKACRSWGGQVHLGKVQQEDEVWLCLSTPRQLSLLIKLLFLFRLGTSANTASRSTANQRDNHRGPETEGERQAGQRQRWTLSIGIWRFAKGLQGFWRQPSSLFFFLPRDLSPCSLSCWMGQWEQSLEGRIESYFNRI